MQEQSMRTSMREQKLARVRTPFPFSDSRTNTAIKTVGERGQAETDAGEVQTDADAAYGLYEKRAETDADAAYGVYEK
jgi:hypothetical protein